ncbi:MAG: glucosamine-6-phosphate deaminase [Oscillospiraceae bacterium]|nr:glucosamine-6-phosphate deaminase [Oscillospiraceae bacterium]
MIIIRCEDYDEMSCTAAEYYVELLQKKPNSVLGLATGSTPLGLYEKLVEAYEDGVIDFSQARSFNLDEYYPIEKNHPQSYHSYMYENFLGKVNFQESQIPNGEAADPENECIEFDKAINLAGGIDLLLLGIGTNGHIGFNEPSISYTLATHLTELAESTIEANSRFFADGELQPRAALTMGFGNIFASKSILMLISGASKRPIVQRLLDDKIHTDVPASLLSLHPDFTIIIDREALGD